METLSVLKLLVRRRLFVALGLVLAMGTAAMVSGRLGVGPFAAQATVAWHVTSQVQVDTPKPQLADVEASSSAIQTQTILLGDYLTTVAAHESIARKAGLPPADFAVSTPTIDAPVRPSPLALAGQEAAVTYTKYSVTAAAWTVSPLMTLIVSGPDKAVAERLSKATIDELIAGQTIRSPDPQLVVRQLATGALTATTASSASLPKGVAAGVFVFIFWCGMLVILTGMGRLWRSLPPTTTATAP